MIVGIGELVDSLQPLTHENYASYHDFHRIPAAKVDEVIERNWIYPWVFDRVVKLDRPVPYRHKSGAVIFVTLSPEEVAAVVRSLEQQGGLAEISAEERPVPTESGSHVSPRPPGPAASGQTDEPVSTAPVATAREVQSSVPAEAEDVFVFKAEVAQALGRPLSDGRFLVLAGSTAMKNGSPTVKRDRPERERLVEIGVLVDDTDHRRYRFAVDHVCNSPSSAAGIVKDGNTSGPQAWKHVHSGVVLRDHPLWAKR